MFSLALFNVAHNSLQGVYNELQDIYYFISSNATLRSMFKIIGPAWSELVLRLFFYFSVNLSVQNAIPYNHSEFEPYVDYANYHPYPSTCNR